jgi:DNA (cytosine-5)-methyltransferase 1
MPLPTAIDCFAGCGGLSRGLRLAGFDIRAAVEINAAARKTYAANHPSTTLFKDVLDVTSEVLRETLKGEPLSLLAGCAPCEGFCSLTSKKKDEQDPRNVLLLRMAEFVEDLKPDVVMMENVPGLAKRGHEILRKFISTLQACGYPAEKAWQVVQMADYGIPQSRRRLLMLVGRGFEIPFPKPTHSKNPAYGSGLKNWLSLRHVIGNETKPISLTKARASGGPRKHKWHVIRNLQPQVAARLSAAIPGETWLALEESIRPDCHREGYRGFTNTYGRMTWDQVPVTITAGCTTPSKGRFGHPEKKRTTISVREAAVIQTFPRSYKFETDYMDVICEMIGNAVPPKFGFVIGKRIQEELKKRHESLARP